MNIALISRLGETKKEMNTFLVLVESQCNLPFINLQLIIPLTVNEHFLFSATKGALSKNLTRMGREGRKTNKINLFLLATQTEDNAVG